ETAGDEQRLVAACNAEPLELLDRCGNGLLARVALRAGQRQVRRLDDDGRACGRTRNECFERRSGKWKAKGISNGRGYVGDALGGRRRTERDCIVVRRDD